MFLLNVIDYILQFDFSLWLFGGFGFFGLNLCVQRLIFGGNR